VGDGVAVGGSVGRGVEVDGEDVAVGEELGEGVARVQANERARATRIRSQCFLGVTMFSLSSEVNTARQI